MPAEKLGLDEHGYYCVTNTRGRWYPNVPRAVDVEAQHMLALAHVPRFAGHTPRRYSVMEHSLFVLDRVRVYTAEFRDEMVQREVEWAALVHDADEAYWPNDVPTPVKVANPWIARLCERRQDVVYRALRVARNERTQSIVTEADRDAFRAEWAWVMGEGEAPPTCSADGGVARWVREWNELRPLGVASVEVPL